MLALQLLLAYLVAGLVGGLAFVLFGVERAIGDHAQVSFGARVLLFPGAVILWPVVLTRWLKASARA
jgi:hypothetical protein